QHVNLLIIDPVDAKAIVPAIKAANKAHIPVFILVTVPTGGTWVARIYLDQVKFAEEACGYLASLLPKNNKTVIQLQGVMSVLGYAQRSQGCQKALHTAGVKIVAHQQGGGVRTEAQTVVEDLLQVNPNVAGVFGANDEEALGAVGAFKAEGKNPVHRVIVGIDGTQDGLTAMCKGEMKATITNVLPSYAAMQ